VMGVRPPRLKRRVRHRMEPVMERSMRLISRGATLLIVSFSFFSLVVAVDVEDLKKVSSFLALGEGHDSFKRVPQKTFALADTVYLLTVVSWEPVGSAGGRHKMVSKWYADGTLVSEVALKLVFRNTPIELRNRMLASALGTGKHRVDLYLDGKLYDSQSFEVSEPESRGAEQPA
jgi:hypothetical protein